MEKCSKEYKKYLIEDGLFLVNIKNYKEYTMEDDFCRIAKEEGFKLFGHEYLKIMKRNNQLDKDIKGEKIFIFYLKSDNKKLFGIKDLF